MVVTLIDIYRINEHLSVTKITGGLCVVSLLSQSVVKTQVSLCKKKKSRFSVLFLTREACFQHSRPFSFIYCSHVAWAFISVCNPFPILHLSQLLFFFIEKIFLITITPRILWVLNVSLLEQDCSKRPFKLITEIPQLIISKVYIVLTLWRCENDVYSAETCYGLECPPEAYILKAWSLKQ